MPPTTTVTDRVDRPPRDVPGPDAHEQTGAAPVVPGRRVSASAPLGCGLTAPPRAARSPPSLAPLGRRFARALYRLFARCARSPHSLAPLGRRFARALYRLFARCARSPVRRLVDHGCGAVRPGRDRPRLRYAVEDQVDPLGEEADQVLDG